MNAGVSADADSAFQARFAQLAGARFGLVDATGSHEPFLRALSGETLRESTQRAGGDPAVFMEGPLLQLQFEAQARAYRAAFPSARDHLVLRRAHEAPVGRILIDWGEFPNPVTLIDIAVLPSARRGAPGWLALRAWLHACDRFERPASLHVMPDNPARLLYRRLGFVEQDLDAFPVPMLRVARLGGSCERRC